MALCPATSSTAELLSALDSAFAKHEAAGGRSTPPTCFQQAGRPCDAVLDADVRAAVRRYVAADDHDWHRCVGSCPVCVASRGGAAALRAHTRPAGCLTTRVCQLHILGQGPLCAQPREPAVGAVRSPGALSPRKRKGQHGLVAGTIPLTFTQPRSSAGPQARAAACTTTACHNGASFSPCNVRPVR
jgi:hypothetical protein